MTWHVDPTKRCWRTSPVPAAAYTFHTSLPEYVPTPLVELRSLASELSVGRVLLKDESSRWDLPAFKILGVSWAVNCALSQLAGFPPAPDLHGLRAIAPTVRPLTLTTATDGNHGRALARMASLLDLDAHIVVPTGLPRKVIAAIEAEGATVEGVAGSYDDAVAHAELNQGVLIQDTAWPGYEQIPRWIVEGYATLAREVDAQLEVQPNLVAVPTGVGSLLQAMVTHYRSGTSAPAVLSVEPETAACVLQSVATAEVQSVPTPGTIMAGLNCGTPSSIAWPVIRDGLDASVAITDAEAMRAVADLGNLGVSAGPCGAASLAGVRIACAIGARREALGIHRDSVVLLINTEGLASGSAS